MNSIYRIFCWIGGGNRQILEELPTVRNRFLGYGTVIFMTAVFATLSATFALSYLADGFNWIIFIPALFWGLFIFLLDRFFVVSISNSGSFLNRFFNVLPRLILAVFIGVVISKPIEYKIFEREIAIQLDKTKQENAVSADMDYQRALDSLQLDREQRIANLPGGEKLGALEERKEQLKLALFNQKKLVERLQDSLIVEVTGSGGSKIRGIGKVAKFKRGELEKEEKEEQRIQTNLDKIEKDIGELLTDLESSIQSHINPWYEEELIRLESERKENKERFEGNTKASILNQQIALSQIKTATLENGEKEFPGASITITFITLLFIFIEMAPMTLKLMSKSGPYERRLRQLEAVYSTEERLRRSLNLEEYKSNRKLVQKLAFSQRKIISKALDEWYDEQVRKLEDDPSEFRKMFNE